MKFIDTHTHLYLKEFSTDIDEVIQRAEDEGVEKFYLPAIDSSETSALFELEKVSRQMHSYGWLASMLSKGKL